MIVDPFAIVCVTEPVELGGGGGGGVWLLTVAVTVLVASRVPVSLSARTWKVCVPFVVVIDAVGEAVTERGVDLGEHLVAVDQELDRAGVVLDLVAVCVVDGTPVDEIRRSSTRSRSSASPSPSSSAAAA